MQYATRQCVGELSVYKKKNLIPRAGRMTQVIKLMPEEVQELTANGEARTFTLAAPIDFVTHPQNQHKLF
jgi:hypothetical protein